MNRRGFLQFASALLAAAVVPVAGPDTLDVRRLRGIVGLMKASGIEGDYLAVMHPRTYVGFVSLCRRAQWGDAYRAWRKLGKPGDADARSIFARYAETLDDAIVPSLRSGDLGHFESVRFIESVNPVRHALLQECKFDLDRKVLGGKAHWQQVLPARERRWM